MKKILLITTAILMANFLHAQNYHPFPESNAQWSEFFQGNYSSFAYQNVIQTEDTIIGSNVFHKLYRQQVGYNTTCIGAIAEDSNKQIFFYDNVSGYKFLLYDFSLNINDTIFYPDTILGYYSYFSSYLVVSDIDSIFDGNDYRKRYYVGGDIWFEGIGSINGLLNPITPLLTCYCDWDLVCFSSDSIVYCPYDIDNIIDHQIVQSNDIIIYPIPADDYLIIKSVSPGEKQICLINSLGNVVFNGISSSNEFQFDLKDYKSGIYNLIIRTENNIVSKKIVIK
jgi:hypothetical protein